MMLLLGQKPEISKRRLRSPRCCFVAPAANGERGRGNRVFWHIRIADGFPLENVSDTYDKTDPQGGNSEE
jgi:hypothetical protein